MIFIWDNGEEFLDHSVWFIDCDLEREAVEQLLNAAVNPFSRRGGVVAVIEDPDEVTWRQHRVESLDTWFTCHGDELVDWRTRSVHDALRRLPPDVVRQLAARLYPSNAQILVEKLGLDP